MAERISVSRPQRWGLMDALMETFERLDQAAVFRWISLGSTAKRPNSHENYCLKKTGSLIKTRFPPPVIRLRKDEKISICS